MKRVFLLLPLLTAPAFAQEEAGIEIVDGQKVRYQQETHVDFLEVGVDGHMVVPEIKLSTERPPAKFNPLIKVRYDFEDMMAQSVSEVR